jgi:hypothetical protein
LSSVRRVEQSSKVSTAGVLSIYVKILPLHKPEDAYEKQSWVFA